MYIVNRRKNIRLIGCEHFIDDDFTFVIYKVKYCTNPYIN